MGAFAWAGTFISLGKVVGPSWAQYHATIIKYIIIFIIIIVLVYLSVYIYRKHKTVIVKASSKK